MAPRFQAILKVLLAVAVVTAAAVPAQALPIIRFDQTVDLGTVKYDVLGGPLKGIDIGFNFVTVTGTGITDGTYACSGCLLNFETGANVTTGPTLYEWSGGGSFVITGEIVGVTPAFSSVTLLTGSFSVATATGVVLPGPDTVITAAFGLDTKHSDIMSFFGLPSNFRFATTNIQSSADIAGDGTFEGNVTEADVTNTAPEPGSTLLLLLGLGSLAAYRRRR